MAGRLVATPAALRIAAAFALLGLAIAWPAPATAKPLRTFCDEHPNDCQRLSPLAVRRYAALLQIVRKSLPRLSGHVWLVENDMSGWGYGQNPDRAIPDRLNLTALCYRQGPRARRGEPAAEVYFDLVFLPADFQNDGKILERTADLLVTDDSVGGRTTISMVFGARGASWVVARGVRKYANDEDLRRTPAVLVHHPPYVVAISVSIQAASRPPADAVLAGLDRKALMGLLRAEGQRRVAENQRR